MKTIKVKKIELLKKLKENLNIHVKLVEDARKGYKKVVQKTLEELLETAKKGEPVIFHQLTKLTEPIDKTVEYERAIQMLEMEVEDEVEISNEEFRNFVQDDWDWKEHVFLSNTRYLNA